MRASMVNRATKETKVSQTLVLAPVSGRAVALADVPDPVFSAGMVGYGAAVDPPRGIVDAVAPVSGKLIKLMPHAYIILGADNTGVLVHLGLDTVQLGGQGVQSRCWSRSPPEPLPMEDRSLRTEVPAGEGDTGRERGETWNTGGKRSNVTLLAKSGQSGEVGAAPRST